MISQGKIATLSNEPDGRFPQEVYHIIIDEVALSCRNGHDRSSLPACSLVSRSFVPRCRHHIYQSLEIPVRFTTGISEFENVPVFSSCAEVLKRFQSAPHLSALVRTLDLDMRGTLYEEEDKVDLEYLPAIFEALPSVQTFKMIFPSSLWESWQRPGLPGLLQTHRLDFLSLSQLTSIYLRNVYYFPIAALTILPNLSNLYLSHVSMVDQSGWQKSTIGKGVQSIPIRLLSLEFVPTQSILVFNKAMQELKLENLHFDAQAQEDVHPFSSILSCSGDSLDSLGVDVRFLRGDLSPASLTNLNSLRHLLILDVLDHHGVNQNIRVLSLLESLPRTNQLESLILYVYIWSYIDSPMDVVSAGIWGKLDNLLSLSTYSLLQTFTLHICPSNRYEEWEGFEQHILAKFPLLQQSASKTFNIVIRQLGYCHSF